MTLKCSAFVPIFRLLIKSRTPAPNSIEKRQRIAPPRGRSLRPTAEVEEFSIAVSPTGMSGLNGRHCADRMRGY
ncbi:MAG: hypothetical protein Ct9H300mP25_12740 [Acidobacteriota bacterium]|nr:MAG: hypothetical protein Ct9H300mP25_12740 [Acidobacteriota bacterium]